ncbi:hypothetical protein C5167_039776, partial [Papaver somniferum]
LGLEHRCFCAGGGIGALDEKANIELDGGKWRLEFLTSRMHRCSALHEAVNPQQ